MGRDERKHALRQNAMNSENGKEPLVQVKNLKKYFPILRGVLRRQVGAVQAVDSITFDIFEVLGSLHPAGIAERI